MKRPPQFWQSAEREVLSPEGQSFWLTMWGWSTSSLAEARDVATQRIGEAAARIAAGRIPSGGYYPRLPLREPQLADLVATDGSEALLAVVTRNRYGAEVLNTDAPLIADVDLPDPRPAQPRTGWRAWFGSGIDAELAANEDRNLADATERIDAFAAANPGLGVRTYRTFAGLRVIVTGGDLPPGTPASEEVLAALDSDPVYVLLCATHKTYRARLTPKPWRCDWYAIDVSWPPTFTGSEGYAKRWEEGYAQHSRGFDTCRLLTTTGPPPSAREQQVIDLHDAVSGASGSQPLA